MNPQAVNQTFHRPKQHRNQAIGCLVFFIVMGAANAYGAWIDTANDRRALAAMFASIFWGGWACLSLWMIVFYHRARLQIANDRITEGGIVRQREIEFDRVKSLRWQSSSVKLATESTRIAIRLDDFEPAVRLCLIRFIRKRLPAEIQMGWAMFCHRVAVPLRERMSGLDRVPGADEVRILRRR